jgi:hypothetical protein
VKETTFLIRQLDNGWDWLDIYSDDVAVQYLCEELEVPEEVIEEVECFEGAMKLSLVRDTAYKREDWYVNLQRVA